MLDDNSGTLGSNHESQSQTASQYDDAAREQILQKAAAALRLAGDYDNKVSLEVQNKRERAYASGFDGVAQYNAAIYADPVARCEAEKALLASTTRNTYHRFLKLAVNTAWPGTLKVDQKSRSWITRGSQIIRGGMEGGHVLRDSIGAPLPGSFERWLYEPDDKGRTGWAKGLAAHDALESVQRERAAKETKRKAQVQSNTDQYKETVRNAPVVTLSADQLPASVEPGVVYAFTFVVSEDGKSAYAKDFTNFGKDPNKINNFLRQHNFIPKSTSDDDEED